MLLKNAPAGHTLHCDAFVAPAGLVAPYPHDVHAALPAEAYVFAGQIVQSSTALGHALITSNVLSPVKHAVPHLTGHASLSLHPSTLSV